MAVGPSGPTAFLFQTAAGSSPDGLRGRFRGKGEWVCVVPRPESARASVQAGAPLPYLRLSASTRSFSGSSSNA